MFSIPSFLFDPDIGRRDVHLIPDNAEDPSLFTYSTSGFVVRAVRNRNPKHPLQIILGSNCFINGSLLQFTPKLVNPNTFSPAMNFTDFQNMSLQSRCEI